MEALDITTTTGSASLGSPWQVISQTAMPSGSKTVKGGNYQITHNLGVQGVIDFNAADLPSPANVDANAQWWYDQAISRAQSKVQYIRDQFIANLHNGVTVNYVHFDFTVLFNQLYIPADGHRTFTLTGQQTVQFTDVSDPFGIDDFLFALLLIYILGAIIAVSITAFYMLAVKVIQTIGPVGTGIAVAILAVGAVVVAYALVGGSFQASRKGVRYRGKRRS